MFKTHNWVRMWPTRYGHDFVILFPQNYDIVKMLNERNFIIFFQSIVLCTIWRKIVKFAIFRILHGFRQVNKGCL